MPCSEWRMEARGIRKSGRDDSFYTIEISIYTILYSSILKLSLSSPSSSFSSIFQFLHSLRFFFVFFFHFFKFHTTTKQPSHFIQTNQSVCNSSPSSLSSSPLLLQLLHRHSLHVTLPRLRLSESLSQSDPSVLPSAREL